MSGRVAKTGEVKVTDSFFIERYSHVMHLVSNVEGNIRDGLDAVDALAAGLPAGTLSGAPKIRAMEIIDEFEKEKRGAAYAGAVGYFAADGSMDTCIVLRTARGEGRHDVCAGRRRRGRRQRAGSRIPGDRQQGQGADGRGGRSGARNGLGPAISAQYLTYSFRVCEFRSRLVQRDGSFRCSARPGQNDVVRSWPSPKHKLNGPPH